MLLKLKYCGVCHSDVHIRDGYFDMGGGKRFHMSERGHESAPDPRARALRHRDRCRPEAGEAPIGQDRLVCPWIGCGTCARCLDGQDNHCMAPRWVGVQRTGGYSDHLLIPHSRYLVDASGVDPLGRRRWRAPDFTTYSAVSKLTPIPRDEWVVVIGAGGLGLMAIGMLRAIGHERIVCRGHRPDEVRGGARSRRRARLSTGGDPDAAKQLQQIAGGPFYGGVDLVNNPQTASLALRRCAKAES